MSLLRRLWAFLFRRRLVIRCPICDRPTEKPDSDVCLDCWAESRAW